MVGGENLHPGRFCGFSLHTAWFPITLEYRLSAEGPEHLRSLCSRTQGRLAFGLRGEADVLDTHYRSQEEVCVQQIPGTYRKGPNKKET